MGRISRSYPKGKLKLRAPKKAQPDKKYQVYIEYNWQADNARKSTSISVFANEWNENSESAWKNFLRIKSSIWAIIFISNKKEL